MTSFSSQNSIGDNYNICFVCGRAAHLCICMKTFPNVPSIPYSPTTVPDINPYQIHTYPYDYNKSFTWTFQPTKVEDRDKVLRALAVLYVKMNSEKIKSDTGADAIILTLPIQQGSMVTYADGESRLASPIDTKIVFTPNSEIMDINPISQAVNYMRKHFSYYLMSFYDGFDLKDLLD